MYCHQTLALTVKTIPFYISCTALELPIKKFSTNAQSFSQRLCYSLSSFITPLLIKISNNWRQFQKLELIYLSNFDQKAWVYLLTFGQLCLRKTPINWTKKQIKIAKKSFIKHLTFFENFRYSSVKSNKKLSASLTLA